MNATIAQDNVSITITWANVSYAEAFNIYISQNFTNFSSVPNATGIKDNNWTDFTAGDAAVRFYRVGTVNGGVNQTSNITVAKHQIGLPSGWNMVSIPLTQNNWVLRNTTNGGQNLSVNPPACISQIWRYNSTLSDPWEVTLLEQGSWTPATGDTNFTSLEPGKGYWMYNNASIQCNLTLVGMLPTANLTVNLNSSFNLQSWYSEQSPVLPSNCEDPYPFAVTPRNAITKIYYYNTSSATFKGTTHFTAGLCTGSDWGWFPDSNSQEFTSLRTGIAYYISSSQTSSWTIESIK